MKISAIIPCYNEESTVSNVIKTLVESTLIDEVIFVDDGSTDSSLESAREFKDRITIIDLKENKGKGYALSKGINMAKGDLVSFFDADLVNLDQNHIETLFNPILKDNFRGVIGYPVKDSESGNPFIYLAGERVYYRDDLIRHTFEMEKTRFGVEMFINNLYKENEVKVVPLIGLKGLFKTEKRNLPLALKEYIFEMVEVAMEMGKQKGLVQEEMMRINRLKAVHNYKEFKENLLKIKDIDIKNLFSKYFIFLEKRKSTNGTSNITDK